MCRYDYIFIFVSVIFLYYILHHSVISVVCGTKLCSFHWQIVGFLLIASECLADVIIRYFVAVKYTESLLSPRKLSQGIMESPAYVCLSICLSVTTITK